MPPRCTTTRTDRRRISVGSTLGIFGLALIVAGCGGEGGKEGASPAGAEPVVVDGSSTVFRISKAAQEAFGASNPEVEVIVGSSGTGGGFTKYLNNEIDIVDASRAAKPEEEAKAKSQGQDWHRFLVGYDGISVVVSAENDFVKELTVDQLARLWKPESDVKAWKDLDPSWPDRVIKFYSPDDKSGTFEFFTEAIVGKSKSQRKDIQASSDDNVLVRGVAGDRDAIGYLGYAYYEANAAKLHVVAVRGKDAEKAVAPNPATILDKSYTPLARPLYIYVKRSSYRRNPAVAQFVGFYLDKIDELATKARYVPPTAEDKTANKATLDAAKAVTPSA